MLATKSEQPVSVAFTEDMKGFFSPGASDPKMGHEQGEAAGRDIMFHLTIKITDVDFFCVDPQLARAITRMGGAIGATLGATTNDANKPLQSGVHLTCLQHGLYQTAQALE